MSRLDELQKLCDEADLFEMRFTVNRKFGEVLNEEDLENCKRILRMALYV